MPAQHTTTTFPPSRTCLDIMAARQPRRWPRPSNIRTWPSTICLGWGTHFLILILLSVVMKESINIWRLDPRVSTTKLDFFFSLIFSNVTKGVGIHNALKWVTVWMLVERHFREVIVCKFQVPSSGNIPEVRLKFWAFSAPLFNLQVHKNNSLE